ncbi:cytochrome P450 [Rhodocollybia butyracea]|uniref:Cytochrome P450 n=1 Tax=Rhodocollybia butyracea TaxID=206335 RepID=A0A9P5UBB0_9AGAR|nr:cytochrome P450 [Rhodocollybia butyracea]
MVTFILEPFGPASFASLVMIGNSYSHPLGVLILVVSYLFWRHVQRKRNTPQKLPMPYSKKTSRIWGHELEIFQHETSEMYLEWATSVGLVYRIQAALFQSDIVIVGDNSAAQHILQNTYDYVKPPGFLRAIRRIVGNCMSTFEGDYHKHQRKLLAPAFTSGAVDAMADDIFSCVDKMTQNLRSTLVSAGGTNGNVVDMVPVISACTLDIIGRVGFGHDFGGGKSQEAKEISSAWRRDVVVFRTFAGFIAPILINVFPWITSLPISAFRDSPVRRVTHRLAGELISNNSTHGRDILSILLNGNQHLKEKSEVQLTITEILDNIALFLMAGHETTAVTIDFILFHLAQNPSIQRKLQHEIRALTSFDQNSIVGLEYLNAVVKEGLRLHPVGPVTERVALQDDVIPLSQAIRSGPSGDIVSSITIKAGQVLRIPWHLLNINGQIWGNNADKFIPERWMEPGGVPPVDMLPHGPWGGVSSFADGPRSCIGFRLAVLELKIITALLVRSFEFDRTEAKIAQYLAPTLQPFADGKASSMPLKVSLAAGL